MTTTSTLSRSDLLRERLRALDELKARSAAARQEASDERIDGARRRVAEELARRDRMERLRREAAAIKQDGLAQRQRIAEADARLEALRRELLPDSSQRLLKPGGLSPRDLARYREARDARDEARPRLGKDREDFAKRKTAYREERMKAEESEKTAGQKEGDVADPCVSWGAAAAGKPGGEDGRAAGTVAPDTRGEARR